MKVASKLGVTPVTVDAWLAGSAQMPHDKFLALIDLLAEIKPGWEQSDKE